MFVLAVVLFSLVGAGFSKDLNSVVGEWKKENSAKVAKVAAALGNPAVAPLMTIIGKMEIDETQGKHEKEAQIVQKVEKLTEALEQYSDVVVGLYAAGKAFKDHPQHKENLAGALKKMAEALQKHADIVKPLVEAGEDLEKQGDVEQMFAGMAQGLQSEKAIIPDLVKLGVAVGEVEGDTAANMQQAAQILGGGKAAGGAAAEEEGDA